MYNVEIANRGDSAFGVKSKDYEFTIEAEGKGVTPPDALLASLGSCIGVYIRKYAEGTLLAIKEFSVSVRADFSKEKPVCFKSVSVTIDLKGFTLDERRRHSLLEFIKNCPVHNTLKADPQIEVTIA